ncbi:MAG TPA: hypothetical protein VGL77_05745 [Armatimonadota bacterium]
MPWETREEFDAFVAWHWAELAPVGGREEMVARRIIQNTWRLEHRLPPMEVGVINQSMINGIIVQQSFEEKFLAVIAPITLGTQCSITVEEILQQHETRLGGGIVSDMKNGAALNFLDRYRRSLERSIETDREALDLK